MLPDAGSSGRLHRQKRNTWVFFLPVNVICMKEMGYFYKHKDRQTWFLAGRGCTVALEDHDFTDLLPNNTLILCVSPEASAPKGS